MWDRLEHFEMRRRSWRGGAGSAGSRPDPGQPPGRGRSWRGGPDAPGPRPDPAQPPGSDRLPQLEHIVVLMMENHSYDNYLGLLTGRGDGFPLGADGEPEAANRNADREPVRAAHLTTTVQ